MITREMLQAQLEALHRRYLRELEYGSEVQQHNTYLQLQDVEKRLKELDKAATPPKVTTHSYTPKPTKIDWCDCTVNPVVGCTRMCGAKFDDDGNMTQKPWCYAYNMNNRFKHRPEFVPDFSKPKLFPERLKALQNKNSKSIFMDSMSDYALWQPEWMELVRQEISINPQHNYIFLTKSKHPNYWATENIFEGRTITTQQDADDTELTRFDFLSVEPILEPIDLRLNRPLQPEEQSKIKQVIIGAENGNRKGKVTPQKQWITDIVNQCDKAAVRVFMKDSLRGIMSEDFRQDALIWEVRK